MERLTDKNEADAQRREYEIRLNQGYPRNIPEERFLRLAAYEDTGLMPEEITTGRLACVFYCNRQCNLNGDFCAEGPGCPWELTPETAMRLLESAAPNNPLTASESAERAAHGQWQGEGDGYADGEIVYDVWRCSECDHVIDDGTDNPELLPNYCPNCGAKMTDRRKPGRTAS